MDNTSSSRFHCLEDWLQWLESLHPKAIDLGLERVFRVASKLELLLPPSSISHQYSGALAITGSKVITVAGTNGKGSCVAALEACLLQGGQQTGSYTSPHLHTYNERIRINGELVSDQQICDAFTAIDNARGDISLTYFEFGTLAALWIFKQEQVAYVLLEVGLGGRLDAVNIVDADIAVITSIAIDHEEWLGSDREKIALEKLGVTRKDQPVVIAETELTQSLIAFSESHNPCYLLGRDFNVEKLANHQWSWASGQNHFTHLPKPNLPVSSVAAALQVLYLLNKLPQSVQVAGLMENLQFAGRYQRSVIIGKTVIFDVAHNPAAAQALAERLRNETIKGNTIALFSALMDKDITQMLVPLESVIDTWAIASLANVQRGASIQQISDAFIGLSVPYMTFDSIGAACDQLLTQVSEHDRIVVLGSFYTVAEAQKHLKVV